MKLTDKLINDYTLPAGRHPDPTTPGLVLMVRQRPSMVWETKGVERPYTAQSWTFRFRDGEGRWRELGLGPTHLTSLTKVRAVADKMRGSDDPEHVREAAYPGYLWNRDDPHEREPLLYIDELPDHQKSNRLISVERNVGREKVRHAKATLGKDDPKPARMLGRDGKWYPVKG